MMMVTLLLQKLHQPARKMTEQTKQKLQPLFFSSLSFCFCKFSDFRNKLVQISNPTILFLLFFFFRLSLDFLLHYSFFFKSSNHQRRMKKGGSKKEEKVYTKKDQKVCKLETKGSIISVGNVCLCSVMGCDICFYSLFSYSSRCELM